MRGAVRELKTLVFEGSAERHQRIKERFEEMDLTRQERRIAMMLLDGEGSAEIRGKLFITRNTLKFHIRNINRKLGVGSRRELPDLARRLLGGPAPEEGPARIIDLEERRARYLPERDEADASL